MQERKISTTVRTDRATLERIDERMALVGFRSRSAYFLHTGLTHGDTDDEAVVRALVAIARTLHQLHSDALAHRPALPPAVLDDFARRTRRALAAVAVRC